MERLKEVVWIVNDNARFLWIRTTHLIELGNCLLLWNQQANLQSINAKSDNIYQQQSSGGGKVLILALTSKMQQAKLYNAKQTIVSYVNQAWKERLTITVSYAVDIG